MTDTLRDTMLKHAKEWTDEDLLAIVVGLREQRERWNIEQDAGSRKRVTSASISAKPRPKTIAKVLKLTI